MSLRRLTLTVILALAVNACASGAERIETIDDPQTSLTTSSSTSLNSSKESTASNARDTESVAPTGLAADTTSTVYEGPLAVHTGLPDPNGLAVDRPAIVVKIGNNDAQSRPQMGLAQADIVFEQLVEGLKTRFAAVFQSHIPFEVGPVRSARTTDVNLLAGLGTPAFVFSGANATTLNALRRAAAAGVFVDAGALRTADPFRRLETRRAPYNLWANLANLSIAGAQSPTRLVTHGQVHNNSATEIGGVEISYQASFARTVSHLWDPAVNGWVRVQDGTLHATLNAELPTTLNAELPTTLNAEPPTTLNTEETAEIAPTNVVVVQVVYKVSPADSSTPEAQTFGSGAVQVFTRGQMVQGTWSRSEQDPRWDLRDNNGNVIALEPGTTWIILAATDGSRFRKAAVTTFDRATAATRLAEARAAQ